MTKTAQFSPKKALIVVALMALIFLVLVFGSKQTKVVGQRRKVQIKSVAEFPHNDLCDISADGKLLLFFQTQVPVRSYTLRPGEKVQPNQPETFGEVLRVVDFASKSEVASVGVNFFPSNARFVPTTKLILYNEPRKPITRAIKLWDFVQNHVTECSPDNFSGVGHLTFLNAREALVGYFRSGIGDRIAKLSLPNCKLQDFGPATLAENKYDALRTPTYDLAISPDKKHVAYEGGKPLATYIRDISTFELVKLLAPPEGFSFASYQLYTPDQKYLLLLGAKAMPATPDFDKDIYYVFFYELPTYKLVRTIELGSGFAQHFRSFALAVSHDSRFLAVSNKKVELTGLTSKNEQAYFLLYDLVTGQKIAEAAHPVIKYNRNNPFASKIRKLAFLPDGVHILSSTDDTYLWRIEELNK